MGDELEHNEVGELPLLAGIAAFLRWCEELVVLLSGPLLLVGLGIGLVALLSDGALLLTAPWLLYAWAISQTVGVDGQLVGAWYRVSVAIARKRWGVALAFILLGLLLAYIAYVASLVFATQQAYHLTTGQALAHLGMDSTNWLWQRSAVSVLLVCLSGYLRYRAPRRWVPSLEEQKRAIQEQMELEALKRARRTQQAQGAIGLLKGMAQAAPGQRGQQSGDSGAEGGVSAAAAAPLSGVGPALQTAWPRIETTRTPMRNEQTPTPTPTPTPTHALAQVSQGSPPLVVVSLHAEQPVAAGRQWTAADYARRDAALAALGIGIRRFQPGAAHAHASSE